MNHRKADLQWASFHARHIEQLVADQRARIAQFKALGVPTATLKTFGVLLVAQDLLK
jgi:hypothetical protein